MTVRLPRTLAVRLDRHVAVKKRGRPGKYSKNDAVIAAVTLLVSTTEAQSNKDGSHQ